MQNMDDSQEQPAWTLQWAISPKGRVRGGGGGGGRRRTEERKPTRVWYGTVDDGGLAHHSDLVLALGVEDLHAVAGRRLHAQDAHAFLRLLLSLSLLLPWMRTPISKKPTEKITDPGWASGRGEGGGGDLIGGLIEGRREAMRRWCGAAESDR